MRCIFLKKWMAAGIAAGLLACATIGAGAKPAALTPREAFNIATEAYIFGYPLVTMDMARRVMTNVRAPEGMRAPLGQFARIRTYPLASNHEVTLPNTDMLYTIAWLDVSQEPWVVSLPDTQGRYASFPMLDGWTTVFEAPGKRTTGTGPQQYAMVGPNWKGRLPPGLKKYKSPTSIVQVLGRVYCSGTPADYDAAHAIQDQCLAMPLSSYGKTYTPPPGLLYPDIDMKRPVREQVNGLGVADYFSRLAVLMKENPPSHADKRIIKNMARLGIVPGKPFDISRLAPAVIQVLEAVPGAALAKVAAWPKAATKSGDWSFKDGWTTTLKTGDYGLDYTQRALIAAIALGANRPQDVVAAVSSLDGTDQPYSGNSRYVMHFAPGKAPSANGFWSLTMYDGDYFFVDNPLGRYALSARDQLQFNPDGSLDVYIQKHPPGIDRESNWLPAPEGKFVLMLRFYWPKESLIDGSWKIPPVKRQD